MQGYQRKHDGSGVSITISMIPEGNLISSDLFGVNGRNSKCISSFHDLMRLV